MVGARWLTCIDEIDLFVLLTICAVRFWAPTAYKWPKATTNWYSVYAVVKRNNSLYSVLWLKGQLKFYHIIVFLQLIPIIYS